LGFAYSNPLVCNFRAWLSIHRTQPRWWVVLKVSPKGNCQASENHVNVHSSTFFYTSLPWILPLVLCVPNLINEYFYKTKVPDAKVNTIHKTEGISLIALSLMRRRMWNQCNPICWLQQLEPIKKESNHFYLDQGEFEIIISICARSWITRCER
jgi:hypothetical protein